MSFGKCEVTHSRDGTDTVKENTKMGAYFVKETLSLGEKKRFPDLSVMLMLML